MQPKLELHPLDFEDERGNTSQGRTQHHRCINQQGPGNVCCPVVSRFTERLGELQFPVQPKLELHPSDFEPRDMTLEEVEEWEAAFEDDEEGEKDEAAEEEKRAARIKAVAEGKPALPPWVLKFERWTRDFDLYETVYHVVKPAEECHGHAVLKVNSKQAMEAHAKLIFSQVCLSKQCTFCTFLNGCQLDSSALPQPKLDCNPCV